MDSAKNKKLFPELTSQGEATAAKTFEAYGQLKSGRFSLPSVVWQSFQNDPELAAEFERRVQERVREVVEKSADQERARIFELARQEGVKAGEEQGRKQMEEAVKRVSEIALAILREKDGLLHAHEGPWIQGMSHLLKRFLVPLTPERLSGIRSWLDDAVGEMARQMKVRVVLAPSVLEQIQKAGAADAAGVEWSADPGLKETDLRVELGGSGVEFGAEAQWQRLQERINQTIEKKAA